MPLINKMLGASPWITYTGEHTFFGNKIKGWIECYTDGILSVPFTCKDKIFDAYLLSDGHPGTAYVYEAGMYKDIHYYWTENAGDGGDGGTWKEYYNQVLYGTYPVTISSVTKLGTLFNTTGGTLGGQGGVGEKWTKITPTAHHQPSELYKSAPTKGQDGRVPFTGHSPLELGTASKKLGAGGSGGRSVELYPAPGNADFTNPDSNGLYLQGIGRGGDGASDETNLYLSLFSKGIVIVRWGY